MIEFWADRVKPAGYKRSHALQRAH